uniref:Prostaglandin E2 receptor EP3 subtype n=2 Tax=Latimeria chalumnae TaxID=7897 RepID=H3A3X7_LATCH
RSVQCRSVSVVFPLTMMVTGMVGNTLALLLVYKSYHRKENKKKKSFLLFIGSLALTDFIGQILTSPIVISVYLSNREWEKVDPSGKLCEFFGICMTMFGLCPLFLASAMAMERTLAIRVPHWYSNHVKPRVTIVLVALIWICVFIFAMLPIVGVGQYTLQWPGTWCFIGARDQHIGNQFFASTFAVLGIFCLMTTLSCNVATIKALVTRCKKKTSTSPGHSSNYWERITMETLIQLLGIMCVLCVCWSPLLIMMMKMIFKDISAEQCKTSGTFPNEELQKECNVFLTAIRLASLNQILDPWVYLLLREILLQKFCQLANAVSSCSNEGRKDTQVTAETSEKQTVDS